MLTGLTEPTADVTEVTNGTAYAVRVRAVNEEGAGAWSATAYGTPGEAPAASPPGQPDAPAVEAGNGQVTVTWSAPADDGGAPITSYDLDLAIKGEGWASGPEMLTGLTEPTADVSELTNGTEYAFRVRAVTDAGAGAWSATAYAAPGEPVQEKPREER